MASDLQILDVEASMTVADFPFEIEMMLYWRSTMAALTSVTTRRKALS